MKLDHIAINVDNVFKAVEYYGRTYNAITLYEDLSWAMLKIGDTKIALVLSEEHKPHIAFKCSSFDDFPDGSEIRIHRDGSYYSYQTDPSGNVVERIYYPEEST
jgi:catechol 2,3-dioxygenase-like lactoylglutathione lyase family enzyme